MPFAAVFYSTGSGFWGGNFSEAGNHVFACLHTTPGAKGPWFGQGPWDALVIADVCRSWESTASEEVTAPSVGVNAVTPTEPWGAPGTALPVGKGRAVLLCSALCAVRPYLQHWVHHSIRRQKAVREQPKDGYEDGEESGRHGV